MKISLSAGLERTEIRNTSQLSRGTSDSDGRIADLLNVTHLVTFPITSVSHEVTTDKNVFIWSGHHDGFYLSLR